ncbi:methyltransferase domain-containing protein [Halosquirtibacter laminarini]|uniref:Methyltransferase domain-containing protein n=1 Tax=Halosquirtibacter laminarini TaxID=3374600 RepID=A0AC61NDY8_9BACT|nr:methyltransferase domain-containing protein [Prolixibacteraceae bacterium]
MDLNITIKKSHVSKCFEKGFTTYDDKATVQDMVAQNLVKQLSFLPQKQQHTFEIGSGSGKLTNYYLQKFSPNKYTINDIVQNMFPTVESIVRTYKVPLIERCMGDIESIQVPNSATLIISSSVFQWIENLNKLFDKLSKTQRSGDHLAFSIYTKGTFSTFHKAADCGLQYHRHEEIIKMIEKKYEVIHDYNESIELQFESPREILLHMKETGVNGVGTQWTKSKHLNFIKNYPKDGKFYTLKYNPSYFILKKK